jgi:glutathione synthase
MRCTLTQIAREASVDPETNTLSIRGREIGLVYYRSGYQIDNYISKDSSLDLWKTRALLECSMAIKCPSIDVQLATFKKFQ